MTYSMLYVLTGIWIVIIIPLDYCSILFQVFIKQLSLNTVT